MRHPYYVYLSFMFGEANKHIPGVIPQEVHVITLPNNMAELRGAPMAHHPAMRYASIEDFKAKQSGPLLVYGQQHLARRGAERIGVKFLDLQAMLTADSKPLGSIQANIKPVEPHLHSLLSNTKLNSLFPVEGALIKLTQWVAYSYHQRLSYFTEIPFAAEYCADENLFIFDRQEETV